ncbi:MAG: homocysteine S-methyltransferase family protein [Thermomicrobiales bacterium]
MTQHPEATSPESLAAITILDGGMSRELVRIGAPFRQPEWSAYALIEAPQMVKQVHAEFAAAGADVITTNTYAIVPFHIGQDRFWTQGRDLANLAGQLAREAVAEAMAETGHARKVAGSIPPVFGSYRPDLFRPEDAPDILTVLIEGLSPHVDIWLAETQSSLAEIRAIRTALGNDPRPFWISFTLDDDDEHTANAIAGTEEPRPRSGESLAEIVAWAQEAGVAALLFNCSEAEIMETAIRRVKDLAPNLEVGVYANAFVPETKKMAANTGLCDIRDDLTPKAYLAFARRWVDAGATIVGGCCGIGTAHIARLREVREVRSERIGPLPLIMRRPHLAAHRR